MAVSLAVKERSTGTVDCWMCTKANTIFKTTIEFSTDGSDYGGICLCVEHMDAMVTAALLRHGAEMASKNERWYETPDDFDPDTLTEEQWLLQNGS